MQVQPHTTAPRRGRPKDNRGLNVDAIFDAVDRPNLSMPVWRALRYLLENYAAPISVQDMADLSGRSPFQMIRAFRKELGVTPHALLIQIRIKRATALLKQGVPIAGVAVDVGFVDQTHFTRHFKRMHGDTPGNFLKSRQVGHAENRKVM